MDVTQSSQPIMVHVVEQPVKTTTVGDVLIGSMGLTGVLILVALSLGLALGGLLIGWKLLRARYGRAKSGDSDTIHISPYA